VFTNKEQAMKKNMGSADSIIRLILAATFARLYFTHIVTGTPGVMLAVLAAVFVLTAFIRICPLYLPFGLCTYKNKEE